MARRKGHKGGKASSKDAVSSSPPVKTQGVSSSSVVIPGRKQGWFRAVAQFPSFCAENPGVAMGVILLVLILGWVVYNSKRPWVKMDGLIARRDVSSLVISDEDRTDEYYMADFEYVYHLGDREFVCGFSDDRVGDTRTYSADFEQAVIEAKRRPVGDSVAIYVDSRHPEISTVRLPYTVAPCLLLLLFGVFPIGLAVGAARKTLVGFFVGWLLLACATWWLLKWPAARELAKPYQVRKYLEMVKGYPSLGYVPQNKLRKFNSLEELLKNWGRPDDLWVEDVDSSRSLTLTYRHLADWSEAWSVDFQVSDSGPPVPVGPPRKDDPVR